MSNPAARHDPLTPTASGDPLLLFASESPDGPEATTGTDGIVATSIDAYDDREFASSGPEWKTRCSAISATALGTFVLGAIAGVAFTALHGDLSAVTIIAPAPIRTIDSSALHTHVDPEADLRGEIVEPLPLRTPATAALDGSLTVESSPVGGTVFINGAKAGTTPLAILNQRSGSRVVRVELDGYDPWTAVVRVVAGEEVRIVAALNAAVVKQTASEGATPDASAPLVNTVPNGAP